MFDPVVRGRHTMHINDYTAREKAACWSSAAERRAMREDMCDAIQQLIDDPNKQDNDGDSSSSGDADAALFCRRGLVRHLPDEAHERCQRKAAARQAVLVEQRLQTEEGSNDPEYIAMIYAGACESSREAAFDQALCDECDAWL